jgi:IS4 transposase
LSFDPGTIVVDDRGYNDYHLFAKWTAEGVYFVTRQKRTAVYTVMETKPLSRKRPHILKDEVIAFTGVGAVEKCPYLLRHVEFYDADKEQVFVFLTNKMNLAAGIVAAIYKDRWAIELFFKALKQNLKIKTFVGTSPNVVKIQI